MDAYSNQKQTLPMLVYDGECGFCFYWVRYWQRLTHHAVTYKPYQAVANQYPSIPISEFQRAVQYITPEGEISSGAEASFKVLNNAPNKGLWLKLYYKVPAFAALSEKAYSLISSHRSLAYHVSVLLWGKELQPARYDLIAWIFLRILGMVFFFAFLSFGMQALGLIGHQGIIPIAELVTAAHQQLGNERYWLLPMLFWLNSSDLIIQIICYGGLFLSVLLIFNILPRMNLLLLYLFYLSLCCAGQFFMSFQWDSFLLETGIIGIFVISFQTAGIWLVRWLLFRFMLAGGLVKLLSGDPTWQNFTALQYYFATEPLPTPLAWYAHQLPAILLRMSTACALFIELFVPFLIFFSPPYSFHFCFFDFIFTNINFDYRQL